MTTPAFLTDDVPRPKDYDPDEAITFAAAVGSSFEWDEDIFYTLTDDFGQDQGSVVDDQVQDARNFAAMLRRDGRSNMMEAALTLPLRSAKGKWVGGKGDTGEAEMLEAKLGASRDEGGMKTPFDLVRDQMTSGMAYRRAFFEKAWKRDLVNGGVTYDEIGFRPASTCHLIRNKRNGAMQGFEQVRPTWLIEAEPNLTAQGRIRIESRNAVVYVHGEHRNPLLGFSELEVALWAWKAKQNIMRLWFSGYLEGVALPRTQVSAQTVEDARVIGRAVASAKSSGVIATDKLTDVKAIDVSGKGGDQFKAAIDYLDSVAEESALLGWQSFSGRNASAGGTGSYAALQTLRDFFMQGEAATQKAMDRCVTEQIGAPLVRWNRGAKGVAPRYVSEPLRDADNEVALQILLAYVATPTAIAPPAFYDGLFERTAELLDMDVDLVKKSLTEARVKAEKAAADQLKATQQQAKVAGMTAATGKAVKVVAAVKSGKVSPKKALAGGRTK